MDIISKSGQAKKTGLGGKVVLNLLNVEAHLPLARGRPRGPH